MTTQRECAHDLRMDVLPRHEDSAIVGFQTLILYDSVEQYICTKCGQIVSTHIPDAEDLEYVAALTRVQIPVALSSHEIRFLRTVLDLRAKDLAALMQVENETVSRWELGQRPINPQNEKLLRLIVCLRLADKGLPIPFDVRTIVQMDLRDAPSREDVDIEIHCKRINVVSQRDWRESVESMTWKMEPHLVGVEA